MSFCGKCGAENEDGAKFCCKCGAKLITEPEPVSAPENKAVSDTNTNNDAGNNADANTNNNAGANNSVNTNNNINTNTNTYANPVAAGSSNASNPISKIPTKIIAIAGGAVAVLLLIIIIAATHKPTIKLDDYLTFEQTGFDGYGKVSASIDWDAVDEKYGKKLKFTSKAKKEYGTLLSMFTPIDALDGSIYVELESTSGLSNGDEVAYTWNIDEELYEDIDCKIKVKDGTVEITELEEIGTFEAFDDVEVTFSGTAPNGKISVEYYGQELGINGYNFEVSKADGLSNGDVVTVSIPNQYVQGCAQRVGMVPATLEKEYTVEGLESYVTDRSEITDKAISDMQAQGEDVFNAYAAQRFSDDEELESFTYIGDYLLTAKDFDSWEENIFYMVFSVQVHNTASDSKETYDKVNTFFWYIEFENLMIDENGEIVVDVTKYKTPSDRFEIDSEISTGWFGTKTWSYYGYKTIDELYKNAVTTRIDSYNHQDNIDESKVPETVEEDEEDSELVTEDDSEEDSEEENGD